MITRPVGGLRRALAGIGPDVGLVFAFTAALAVLLAAYGGSDKWKEGPIAISAGIAAALAIALNRPGARAELDRAVVGILRDGGPVIRVLSLSQSLETYTGGVRQTSIDPSL